MPPTVPTWPGFESTLVRVDSSMLPVQDGVAGHCHGHGLASDSGHVEDFARVGIELDE
jgi:hypothetical protein